LRFSSSAFRVFSVPLQTPTESLQDILPAPICTPRCDPADSPLFRRRRILFFSSLCDSPSAAFFRVLHAGFDRTPSFITRVWGPCLGLVTGFLRLSLRMLPRSHVFSPPLSPDRMTGPLVLSCVPFVVASLFPLSYFSLASSVFISTRPFLCSQFDSAFFLLGLRCFTNVRPPSKFCWVS